MPSYAITGSSRGIGLGFVQAHSADPANTVFALVRSKAASQELQQFVAAHVRKNVHILESDNADVKGIQAAANEVSKITGGTLDVLINNGAFTLHERNNLSLDAYPNPEILDEDLTLFFKINVLGPIHTINAFLPLLLAGSTKKCTNITSSVGSPEVTKALGLADITGYSISKAGLNLANAKYAARFKDQGLIFLAITPGLVKTMQGPKETVEKFFEDNVKLIQSAFPDFEGAITIETSARDILALIERTTIAGSGAFVNRDGSDAARM